MSEACTLRTCTPSEAAIPELRHTYICMYVYDEDIPIQAILCFFSKDKTTPDRPCLLWKELGVENMAVKPRTIGRSAAPISDA